MRALAPLLFGIAALLPAPALACVHLVAPGDEIVLTEAQQAEAWRLEDETMRRIYADMEGLAEIEALTAAGPQRAGRARVLAVYKGALAVGTELEVLTPPANTCREVRLEPGRRGLVRIYRIGPQLWFEGFLPDFEIASLRRIGLLPAR